MNALLQDLRYAARALAKSPAFTLTAALTLALGIGASTALFSAVDALLLRPLPLHQPERLVEISPYKERGSFFAAFSYPQFRALEAASPEVLAGLAAELGMGYELSVQAGERTEVLPAAFVSGNYFGVLGVRPAMGRFFDAGDDQPGTASAAVISHAYWRRALAGDPQVIGKPISLKGQPFTVMGVAPEGFVTERIGFGPPAPEIWVPLPTFSLFQPGADPTSGRGSMLELTGRLQRGVSAAQARAALSGAVRDLGGGAPGPAESLLDGVTIRPMDPITYGLRGRVVGYLALLATATALVMLITGTNVAGMLLARAAVRRREIAIRLAIGAGRGRIVRQLLTEGVLLFLAGGAGGVLIAFWAVDLFGAVPWPVPVNVDVGIDGRVLGFALLFSFLTGTLFSLVPALQASRPQVIPALKQGEAGSDHRRMRFRSAFVVLQVVLSLVLLVGAGLFLRALQRAWSIDPGFNPDGVLVARLDLSVHGFSEAAGHDLYGRLLERVRALPGTESATLAMVAPFSSFGAMMSLEIPGSSAAADQGEVFVPFNAVGTDYFRTLAIPLVEGRAFTEADREGAPKVVVVSQAMARRYWPGESPVGKETSMGTVVGVVGDIRESSLAGRAQPTVYVPSAQNYNGAMVLHVRTRGHAGPVMPALRSEIRALDRSRPEPEITTLPRLIGITLLPQRIGAALTAAFGLFGLLLTALGLYGVLSYTVAQRTREIGIRMALGAKPGAVLRHFLRQGVLLTAAGLVLGLAAAAAATRVLSSQLYGVSATDPLTFAAVAALLALVALVASYLPARRATRVDPMVALRAE